MHVFRLHSAPSQSRSIAGLDAVRAAAALGVVGLHSCIPYLEHPMPGLAWPVRDAGSAWVDYGFWWIELFIMPLFLFLAGFFAWQTIQRRGVAALLRSRARRLLKPLAFGMVVILPLDLYCWVLGWVSEGLVAPVKLKSLKFDGVIDRDLWGLSHLWFLQYLFLYVASIAAWSAARARFEALRRIAPSPPWQVASIVVSGSCVLYLHPEVVWGFQHAFIPFVSKWIYSGLFFAMGAVLASHDPQLHWLQRHATRLVAPAMILSCGAVVLGRWHLQGGDQQIASATLAFVTCASALLLTLSMVGVAAQRVRHVSNSVAYIAAASFWIYLLHHPLVGLIHIDLKWLLPGTSPLAKSLITFGLSSAVCLLTYEGLVRTTSLGRWLGFDWQPAPQMERPATVLPLDDSPADVTPPGRRAA